MKRVARCNSCGLVFPADYFEQWGRKYGIGLGPSPVCEGLSSDYSQPCIPKNQVPSSERQIMHPVGVCKGSVSLVDIPEKEIEENTAILAIEDVGMEKRADKMRTIQAAKSGTMRMLIAKFK